MTPKLSIIVPIYNVESYLRECLDSLVNQTFKDLEIIIVNDCSPDNSEAIILEYMSKDPRIKYIKHEKNLGLGGARNTGIQNATGEWISFVDSDDYIELNTYTTMLALIDKHQANLGVFSVVHFDDITKEENFDSYFDCRINNLTTINYQNFDKVSNSVVWNKIFKGSDLIDNDLTFPEHLKHEDEEFWFKYISIVEPSVIACNEKLYHYRQRSNSIVSNTNSRLDLPHIALNIYTFLKQNNLLENYKKILLTQTDQYLKFFNTLKLEDQISFCSDIKNLLHMIPIVDEDLQSFSMLLYLYTTNTIDNNTIMSLFQQDYQNLQQHCRDYRNLQLHYQILQEDKYFRFGQLSRNQKIKQIFVIILQKLKLYNNNA